MLCWRHIFAAFYFLCLVINSDHETLSATTEFSECRLVLSYWEIGLPPLGFCRLDGCECQKLCANSSFLVVWLSQEQALLLFCSPILGGGNKTAHCSLFLMKGAASTTAKCSLWAFHTVREKTVCFLMEILLQACATTTALLLLSLPCVTVPSEGLTRLKLGGRLRCGCQHPQRWSSELCCQQ